MFFFFFADPDQSFAKGSRFKYQQETLVDQLMSEFVHTDCYELLNDFIEETNLDGSNVINNIYFILYLCSRISCGDYWSLSPLIVSVYSNLQ